MATIVKGDLYEQLDGQLHELKRQIRQKSGYPHDPERLKAALQVIIVNPNCVFGTGTIIIDRSRPFDPVKFIGQEGCTIEEEDERSLAITMVNLADISLETTLKESDNGRVQGEEKLRRLKDSGVIRLDAKVFQFFWDNKHFIPESWKGKVVYFDGTVLRSPSGSRCVLCLFWTGGAWDWYCLWLDRGWLAARPSAVLAK